MYMYLFDQRRVSVRPVYHNGTSGANNWPLKGGKMSNYEGGIRVNAFVSGGFVAGGWVCSVCVAFGVYYFMLA